MVVAGANGQSVVMYNVDGFSSQVYLTGLDKNLQAIVDGIPADGGRRPAIPTGGDNGRLN